MKKADQSLPFLRSKLNCYDEKTVKMEFTATNSITTNVEIHLLMLKKVYES